MSFRRRFFAAVAFFATALSISFTTEFASKAYAGEDDSALISFGVGYFDALRAVKDDDADDAADFRLEYRHDEKLWIFKPWAGVEVTSEGGIWGGAGILVDIYFGKNVVLTPNFGVGAFEEGSGLDLDSVIEFRSQIELAYRFEDRSRLGFAISHISNAGIGDENPGTEIATIYYHLPLEKLF
ncbi:acyloxyacyl hydrolase [Denitrobaculum tricleocarpae]|uniref:acyloxyacyl hydrolase n=1 Tax=Denitrobaculum tricleocarpae TaxID=2591009 RepID=UPI001C55584C|nr:acyloxyacyl hydrolase [Denitrobaculum tricleocarpae]